MWLPVAFSILLVLHGLVHLMGVANAFGYADLPQLTARISRPLGLVWLAATGLMLAAAVTLWAWPRAWWILGALAVVASQAAITTAWSDAKFGTVANVAVLAGVVFGWLAFGPGSLRAQYETDVAAGLARLQQGPPITETDIAHLPPPVQRYLRLAGAVGHPRVQNVRVRMHGRIRSGPDAGRTISAELVFNEAGELVDFVSDDRRQSVARGAAMRQLRWSTPVHGYGPFGDARLIAHGAGLWHVPEGPYAYIELTIDDVTYNVAR